ncbi:antA/AntB antirepressor family protein [Rodentibacter caecimuris]|uniref:antA/AntB antirepressor family protein n=1 Tax=Rodentibacter caecimuris TaxID=1796644 RepID=UPI00224939D4|nr:antA/AntB antirepressor family protein [Rodentibacter heylii]MCX2961893.1 antA/AntB antirepressor family protein [Rodentibacter heylii]
MNTNQAKIEITALLPIEETTYKGITTYHVNARTLHGFLENKTRFNDWFKRLVDEYGFIENEDFCVINLSSKKSKSPNLFYSNLSKKDERGRKPIEYKISLDMAKEISMVDKSHQGKRARRYFIACEKRLSEIAPDIHQQELARWKQSRELAKSPFKSMNNALERMRTRQGKLTARNHYINEINMLTGIVLKQSVKQFKAERNIQGDVREHLNANQLERLEYLERANEMLLDSDIHDFEERRFKLQSMLSNRFEKLAA